MNFSSERPFVLIGAGKMGGAMLSGWMAEGIDPSAVVVCDPGPPEEVAEIISRNGILLVPEPPADLYPSLVMIAVKPQLMDVVLPKVAPSIKPDTLVLSVAAGTPIRAFESAFGTVPVARAMPNTPAMVGRGITAVYPNAQVNADHKATIDKLLSAVGQVVWLSDESEIDLVTGVSGSGPAYVFWMAECLTEAGEAAGLSPDTARKLAVATVTGAGELMHQSQEDPSVLRKNVTSPNGTTAAALEVLMAEHGLKPLMTRAVAAAARRAKELAG